MEFRLESSVFKENAIVRNFSRDFRADIFQEETTNFNEGDFNGCVRQIQLDRFCLLIQDLQVPGGYNVNINGDTPFFKLHFELEGDYSYTPRNASEPLIKVPAGHFNILYFSRPNGTLTFGAPSRKTLEVLFTEDFLKKTVGEDYNEQLKDLSREVKKKKAFQLWQESRPIPMELQQNIREIISCRYCGHIKKIYLEARITALLVNFLVDDTANSSEVEDKDLSKTEHAGILKVEQHIRQNYREPITIAELAPIAGLNTSKLKQCFKKQYSTTIFKYITALRMEKAKELIKDEKLSVSEASYEVGYKNPQHFTVAFKKYYGFLPSSLI